MYRATIIALLIGLFGPASALAAEGGKPPPDGGEAPVLEETSPETLLQKALDLWHQKKDYTKALAAFNTAVEAAPDNNQIWLLRGQFLETVSEIVREEDKAKFQREVDTGKMSALEIERLSVRNTLVTNREIAEATGGKLGRFWEMMDRAERAGFMDEAIFLHMLDEPLAAEYPAFRDNNTERLLRYLETLIVPKAGGEREDAPPKGP